jgi:MFS family permease
MSDKTGQVSSREKNYRWLLVVTGFLCMVFFYGIIINCQGQLIEPIAGEQGYSRLTISSIFALINGGMVVSSPLLAHLSDRIGPSKTMVFSAGMISLSILLFATAKSLPLFYISALLIGMAFGGVTVLILPIIINLWFDKNNRGFALSLAFMGSGVGGLLLNPIFAEMVGAIQWRWTYGLWGGFFLIVFTPFLFLVTIYLPGKKGYRPLDMNFSEMDTFDNPVRKATPRDYRITIGVICTASFLIGGMGTSVMMHGNSHLVSLGQTPAEASMTIGLFLGILAFAKLIVGKSCDKLGCEKALMIFLTFASIGVLSLYFCRFSVFGCIAFILFFGLGAASMTVCPPLAVRELFSHERYSKELGKVMASIGLGNMGIPLLAGIIYDKTGSYNPFWIGASLTLLVAMGLFILGFRWGKPLE